MIQNINLLELLPKKIIVWLSWRRMTRLALAWLVLLVVIAALGFGYTFYLNYQLKQYRRQERGLALRVEKINALLPVSDNANSADQSAIRLAEEVSHKEKLLAVLKKKHGRNVMGFSSWLTIFAKAMTAQTWLTRFQITRGGTELTLKGRSTEVGQVLDFVTNLNDASDDGALTFKVVKLGQPTEQPKAKKAKKIKKDSVIEPVATSSKSLEFVVSTSENADED